METMRALKAFVEVVNQGSFIAAANRLSLSNAAVSRQIVGLEQHFGARLLNRTSRNLSLTEPGRELYGRAQLILQELEEAEAVVGRQTAKPSGLLRISAPVSFGTGVFSELLPDFCRRYPEITLDLDLSNRVVDLVNDGVDVAVRLSLGDLSPHLIARRLGTVRMVFCASPDYLARRGTPKKPEDLNAHDFLCFSYLWRTQKLTLNHRDGNRTIVNLTPRVHANNGDVLTTFAREGFGVLLHPYFIAADDLASGRLVQVLPEWNASEVELHALYVSRKHLPLKIRVFVDYLVERLPGQIL
ncbi:LysR substrate-binding domain-containing protein [Martelella mangrovi]|uniref:DNA-binding transcriptional LysR family regulator n=1 Tax=Martelella mangrovi TaxID=1397477 RepID=A0ABV2IA35_9HYPH|nr:LysR family transcriptional regulator [uncultured Martelella sp.]